MSPTGQSEEVATQVAQPTTLARWGRLDLLQPAALVFNPHAGQKVGMTTNPHGLDQVQAALHAEGIPFDLWQTEGPGHATTLAQRAVLEGYKVVIAAGGDGTLHEVARGLMNTDVVLAPLPLGSIMNLARALWVPRDLHGAARTIKGGRVLAIDISRVGPHDFLEAAGVGVGAGLFGYFNTLDNSGLSLDEARKALKFLEQVGTPEVCVEFEGGRIDAKTQAVNIANGPYVGAAVVVAPEARLDDGLLDVTIVDHTSLPRLLMHIALRAGGRHAKAAPGMQIVRTPWVRVSMGQGERPLPVHADGDPAGDTPATFEVVPAALRVVVGEPSGSGITPWALPSS
jgi:YegS/Rv2252/BmrU family lipid kinase